jgi:hypothetical protein
VNFVDLNGDRLPKGTKVTCQTCGHQWILRRDSYTWARQDCSACKCDQAIWKHNTAIIRLQKQKAKIMAIRAKTTTRSST